MYCRFFSLSFKQFCKLSRSSGFKRVVPRKGTGGGDGVGQWEEEWGVESHIYKGTELQRGRSLMAADLRALLPLPAAGLEVRCGL